MADSPLNHSWPSFSKLWMKRWSFKRGNPDWCYTSECKPCESPSVQLSVQPPAPSGKGSSCSLPPASISEDVFFGGINDDQDASSEVSDYDLPCVDVSSSLEDLQGLSSSLQVSVFQRLGGGAPPPHRPPHPRPPLPPQRAKPRKLSLQMQAVRPTAAAPPPAAPHLNGLQEAMETAKPEAAEEVEDQPSMELDAEPDLDSFPILVRSMSTSRRHSWGVPLSPMNSGRSAEFVFLVNPVPPLSLLCPSSVPPVCPADARLSLDTAAIDSDEDTEHDEDSGMSLFQSTQEQPESAGPPPGDEPDKAGGVPGRQLYSRSQILATDDYSRAAHISRVLQTSKQAARAAGVAEEFDPEENLHSTEGQTHMLMVQKVLQELKLYHGAKQRHSRPDPRDSGSVTWYEFLSNQNDEEEDRAEKVEKGTKVKRTLSSLRNRVTGSFNKDKGKNRDKEQQRERAKERDREARDKAGCGGHALVPGSFSSCATCSLCGRSLQRKHGLQCMKPDHCSVSYWRDSLQRVCTSGSPNPGAVSSTSQTMGSSRACSRSGKPPPPSSSASSWGLSGRLGVRVLMHRDMITCRFFRSLPRSWLKKYWGRLGRDSKKSSSPPLRWSSSPFSLPAPHFLPSPLSPVSLPALKDRDREKDPAASQAPDGPRGFPSGPGMTISVWGPQLTAAHSSSSSFGHSLHHPHSSGSLPWEMDEIDALRSKRCNEDAISLAPSTTESIIVEEAHYAAVRAELESDAQDLEAVSWSVAVDQQYLKKHSKEAVKRQDVIYGEWDSLSPKELMQTEMHHVRTLKIMLRVYVRELKENLQMDTGRLDCLFPRLENLLELHTHFLSRLKERRRENLVAPSERNYTINRVADILITQFSGEIGEKMKNSYGDFCSHHTEAVSYYKDQLQNNKKFQNIIRKVNNLSIVRRLGVTECILLVTQRITKYPVLVERILHNTEAGTEEQEDLTRALGLIKDTIVQVDTLVNVHEKNSRLRDVRSKLEPKALGKIKDGRVFRREDLEETRRRLLHEGTVSWKAASGRLKDILAVLLSDVLLLLQEKDQRYVFATVDNKPSVISLQKLIVREVAHEEKAMFLICASSNEPEMYEIHTTSKEERNTWMAHIRQAVESCPHTEERLFSEEEEARAFRLKEFQERLSHKDAVIVQALVEKLQLFADMAESVAGLEDAASRSRLLLRGDASDLQQGETLLKGAITEVENLQNLLQSGVKEEPQRSHTEESVGSGLLPRRADTFGGYDSSPTILNKNGIVKKNFSGESRSRDRSQRASSDPQLKDLCGSHTLEETVDESCSSPVRWNRIWSSSFPEAEFFDRVLMLSQRLYSLQAIIAQQDSQIELQRASLTERASLPGRHRGNVLLEQEKQRTLALQREELASFHKLQSQHRLEQQRWERERERHRQQTEATEAKLRLREEECRRLEDHLAKEKEELDRQRETYQQDLERLRESTRAVEREKERLEHMKKIKRKTIEVAPLSGSLNGELLTSSGLSGSGSLSELPPPQKPSVRPSLSVSPADFPEAALRREGGGLKTEVPLHLFSTTNQQHKAVGVQQQIPTKLAAFSSKGKAGKGGKASHRSDSSGRDPRGGGKY
ncbi:unnamed protein product [Menidia menidia]|uniref:(Atlantic silverside) hypothetical protein n=1 Tax=Menidia menidia TaxID=238744 RepID=A0A8S4AC39_9TELE|nr:unnamed protein product [Menidia menidia]